MLESVHKRCSDHKGTLDELLSSIRKDKSLTEAQRCTLTEQVETLYGEHRLLCE